MRLQMFVHIRATHLCVLQRFRIGVLSLEYVHVEYVHTLSRARMLACDIDATLMHQRHIHDASKTHANTLSLSTTHAHTSRANVAQLVRARHFCSDQLKTFNP